jgi:hypothetical protein
MPQNLEGMPKFSMGYKKDQQMEASGKPAGATPPQGMQPHFSGGMGYKPTSGATPPTGLKGPLFTGAPSVGSSEIPRFSHTGFAGGKPSQEKPLPPGTPSLPKDQNIGKRPDPKLGLTKQDEYEIEEEEQ